MKKHFPPMLNCMRKGYVFCIFVYWILGIVLFPMYMPLIANGLWDNFAAISWVEIVYHAINAVVMILAMQEHLSDAFFEVRYNAKGILKTVAVALGLMLAWAAICTLLFGLSLMIDMFPVAEFTVSLTAGFLVENNPLFGAVCMTLLVPFGICGLFYASGFCTVAYKNTKLAYPVVAVLLLLPHVFDILWRGQTFDVLFTYVLQLPIHLFACWSYQKTDCVWTPIFALSAFNLLASAVCILV